MDLQKHVSDTLKEAFGDNVRIDFHDERNDGKHFYLVIVSDQFEGKSRIERSRIVYSLLDPYLKTDMIHALRMQCKTPSEA